jgi:hypothetical protein
MSDATYQDAVQVLRRRIGARWDGSEDEGRDEMMRVLQEELGFSNAEARDAITAMVETGQLRYVREQAGDSDAVDGNLAQGAVNMGGLGTAGLAGTPLPAAANFTPSYWQVGRDNLDSGTEGPAPGRKGQVTPKGM